MNDPVLILYLEDNPRDADLVRDKLQQVGMAFELLVASDRAEYEAALAQKRFDLILSDYTLPNYDGMAALALARVVQPDVPFILISGTLGDEQAVDSVLRGATDYVLKQRLDRLAPAVLRALTEAEERRKRREAEKSLYASEMRYRRLFEAAKDGILILDAETGMVVDVNPFLVELLGYPRERFLSKAVWELGLFEDVFSNQELFVELRDQEYVRYEDKPLAASDGRRVEVEFVSNVYLVNHHKVIQCNIRDISERKRAEEKIRGQVEELQRWQDVMLGREDRVQELKSEVNELCRRLGETASYPSQEAGLADAEAANARP
jgi:PAS domain S-box-containing protein